MAPTMPIFELIRLVAVMYSKRQSTSKSKQLVNKPTTQSHTLTHTQFVGHVTGGKYTKKGNTSSVGCHHQLRKVGTVFYMVSGVYRTRGRKEKKEKKENRDFSRD